MLSECEGVALLIGGSVVVAGAVAGAVVGIRALIRRMDADDRRDHEREAE